MSNVTELDEVRRHLFEAQLQEYIVKQELLIWAKALQEYLKEGNRSKIEKLKLPKGITQ